jgi:hypothetical protein
MQWWKFEKKYYALFYGMEGVQTNSSMYIHAYRSLYTFFCKTYKVFIAYPWIVLSPPLPLGVIGWAASSLGNHGPGQILISVPSPTRQIIPSFSRPRPFRYFARCRTYLPVTLLEGLRYWGSTWLYGLEHKKIPETWASSTLALWALPC